MPRQLKPQKVGEIADKTGMIDLMFDRNKLKFFAEYELEKFEADTADEVRQWGYIQLKNSSKLEWIPFLEITTTRLYDRLPDPDNKAELSVEFRRYYLAKSRLGEWMKSDWDLPLPYDKKRAEEELAKPELVRRMANSTSAHLPADVTFPYIRTSRYAVAVVTIINYNEEIYLSLGQLVSSIHKIAYQIDQIVKTPEGHDHMKEIGKKLAEAALPAALDNQEEPDGMVD